MPSKKECIDLTWRAKNSWRKIILTLEGGAVKMTY